MQAFAEIAATSPRTREEILTRVQDVLHREFALDSLHAVPDAHLQDDLDLDSIDVVALAMRLEQELGLHLREDRLRRVRTIEDVVGFVFELQTPAAAISRRE